MIFHKLTRLEIVFRHKFCGGTDPRVVLAAMRALRSGMQGVYCVTQPDLMHALPVLRSLFPKAKLATWIWTDWEARRYADRLRSANHIFSLTDSGLAELEKLGFAGRSSLGLWGCNPDFYALQDSSQPPVTSDLLFFGLVSRDTELVRALCARRRFSIAVPKSSAKVLGVTSEMKVVSADSKESLVQVIHSSHVSLIPLMRDDPQPTGFTNLIESLLCGTAVVIAETTLIPAAALQLPGVYQYVPGDLDSFESSIEDALAHSKRPGGRYEIKTAAAAVLNGRELNHEIRRVMSLH